MRQRLAAALLVAACLGACSDLPARIRRHTYPPNFNYITREQLQSAMWQLAEQVHALDRILRQPGPQPASIDEQRRDAVVQHLTAMEQAVKALTSQGWPSNHPLIDANLDTFRSDIARARQAVQADPPSYFLAGSVSGACVYCHERGTR